MSMFILYYINFNLSTPFYKNLAIKGINLL
nr:MAG TPA: hypothetical protein [Caudoviricetes sp.]